MCIRDSTNALRDARVTMYTIDPAGINPAPIPTDENGFLADDPFGGNVDFEAMAQATGGKSYHGRNDVDHLIDGSVQAGIDFYTLSYVPAQVNDCLLYTSLLDAKIPCFVAHLDVITPTTI